MTGPSVPGSILRRRKPRVNYAQLSKKGFAITISKRTKKIIKDLQAVSVPSSPTTGDLTDKQPSILSKAVQILAGMNDTTNTKSSKSAKGDKNRGVKASSGVLGVTGVSLISWKIHHNQSVQNGT